MENNQTTEQELDVEVPLYRLSSVEIDTKKKKKKDFNEYEWYAWYKNTFGAIAKKLLPTYFFGEDFPVDQTMFVGNHLSALDPGYLFLYCDRFKRFISKVEAKKIPIFGKILDNIKAIFMNRGDQGDISSTKKILQAGKRGEDIVIFPEGTRNRGEKNQLLPIKQGVVMFTLRCKMQLVSFTIYNHAKLLSPNYIYIAKPLDLSRYYKQKQDEHLMNEVTDIVQNYMQENRNKVDEFMKNGGAKEIKKCFKQQKKNQKGFFVIKTDKI